MRDGARRSLTFGLLGLACSDALPLAPVKAEAPRARVSTRVFSGQAAMLFDGPACTRERGARGDRYCAFVARGEENARSLYAVNVSAVLAGVAVTCDVPDANCLLLTTALGGDSFDPTQHGTLFQGDTLVYYDDTLAPYTWRPGMTAGRLLVEPSADHDVTFCHPAARGTGVACLVLPKRQDDVLVARGTLHAGRADGETEPLLAPLDDVIAANLRDAVPRFGYFFPEFGDDLVAWTTRPDLTGPETLKVASVDDAASKVTVATDVHDPVVSPDGKRWVWLSAIDDTGVGTLQMAPFPDGGEPTNLLHEVREFAVSPARGNLVARTAMADLLSIPTPSGVRSLPLLLDSKVQELVDVTDTEHVAYAKHFVGLNQFDLYVAKVDGSGTCAVNTTASVHRRSLFFSAGSAGAVYALARSGGVFDGHHTHLPTCSTVPLAPNVVALGWLGDDIVFLMDDWNPDALTGTLRFRRVTPNDRLHPDAPTLIAEHVDTYAISDPDRSTLLYTVNGSEGADGVYVW